MGCVVIPGTPLVLGLKKEEAPLAVVSLFAGLLSVVIVRSCFLTVTCLFSITIVHVAVKCCYRYSIGQKILVAADITANHKGYFEFRLCPHNNPKVTKETKETKCYKK